MSRKSDSGISFLCIAYPENDTKKNLIGNALLRGEDCVWANHYGEPGNKDHTHVIVKTPFAQSISAFAKNHDYSENLIQLCGRDREHKNVKAAIVYLVHQDDESLLLGKKQYSEEAYSGPMREYAIAVLRKYLKTRKRDDEDITLILDWLDRQEHINTADVVRWCVRNNLYSVYRRSASTISNCIREHNNILRYSDPESVLLARIREIEERQTNAEKSLAYLRGVDKRRELAESKAKVDMSLINEMLTRRGFND